MVVEIDIPAGGVPGFSWATVTEDGSNLVSVRSSSFETSGVGVISGIWDSSVLNKCRRFLRYPPPRAVSTLQGLDEGRTCETLVDLADFHLLPSLTTMAQEGHSPVLVFDSSVVVLHSPVMVLHSLVLVFTQSSFNFYTVQFYFLHSPVLFFYTVQFYFYTDRKSVV